MQKQAEIEQLFRKYYARLRLMADRLLHDGEESKDVVSDVFTRLLQADDLPEAGIAEGYLVCSVRNRCMDILAQPLCLRILRGTALCGSSTLCGHAIAGTDQASVPAAV